MRNRLIGGILAMLPLAALPAAAFAQVSIGISVNFAPPPLPVYYQPACPGVGYLWTPGYWAWADDDGDYYWVPGTWVLPPELGVLWTPGWWGWSGGVYVWYPGYWGPQVGFYGGIDYGFGYAGEGYDGGYWRGNRFYYNRSVNNISNTTIIRNVYDVPAPLGRASHVSFNGGQGGVRAWATAAQRANERAPHLRPTAAQNQQRLAASRDRELRASVNRGRPLIAATARPGQFSGRHVIAAVAAGGALHLETRPAAGSVTSARRGELQASQGARPALRQPQPQVRAQALTQAQAERQRAATAGWQQRAQAPEQQRAWAQQAERQRAATAGWQQRAQAPEQQRAWAQQAERQRMEAPRASPVPFERGNGGREPARREEHRGQG